METIRGKAAIEALARRFPQLYVAPAEGAQEAHKLASSLGQAPANANLDHFSSTGEDELRAVSTPAGPVEVLFLKNRGDFETFLQIIGHKSQPVPIAPTVGGTTYRGLADWEKVAQAHAAYVEAGGTNWQQEFARLAKQPGAFRSELVVISEGPYSNTLSTDTPYDEAEWLHISREIRLHHECAHVVCRRTMPDAVLAVWDEISADAVGLLCATGSYPVELAARFFGVSEKGYTGGRLSEYLDSEQAQRIDALAAEVYAALVGVEGLTRDATLECPAATDPFGFLLELKRKPLVGY